MNGLRYGAGREMPPGLQAVAAMRWIRELRQVLKDSIREDEGEQVLDMKHVSSSVPLECVLQELKGTGVVVIDRTGKRWNDGG